MKIFRKRNVIQYNSKSLEEKRKQTKECVERVKRIHRSIIENSKREHENGLEDALLSDAAIQSICNEDPEDFEDVFDYAASALERIAVMHPFVEGNKRTAYAVTLRILKGQHYTLADDDNTCEFIRHVADGRYTKEEIGKWLRANAIRSY